MAFPAITGAYPQSYPQDLWIEKKALKKRVVSALGDISHEVRGSTVFEIFGSFLKKKLCFQEVQNQESIVSCGGFPTKIFLAYSQNDAWP